MAKHVLPVRVKPASIRDAGAAGDDYGVSDSPNWREVNWQDHLGSMEVAGRRLGYVDIGQGDGAPVVFIHGLGGCWQNWLENIPRLAERRRVIAVDLPGFGSSEMPRDKISISGFGRAVDGLADRLDLGQVAVVGNSMGGFTGAEMAIQFPGRVQSLVLVSAAGISIVDLRREPILASARVLTALTARTAAMRRDVAARPRIRHAVLNAIVRHPTAIKADMAFEMMQGAGSPGFVPGLDALTSYDFRDRLPEIEAPTLLVWGQGGRPRSGARRRRVRAPDPDRAQGRVRRHGPHVDGRAATHVQRSARGLPRRAGRAGADGGRGRGERLRPGRQRGQPPARRRRSRLARSAQRAARSTQHAARGARSAQRAECGVRSAECGVRSAECGVRSAECGVRSAEAGPRCCISAFGRI